MTESPIVRDWMTTDPITVTPETKLMDAHKLMMEKGIRRLPILKRGKLTAIITLGDLRGAQPSEATSLNVWEINYLLAQLQVDRVASRPVVTVSPETTIVETAKLMLEHRIAGLPVVENGELVGIITESDIFRMVVEQWKEPAQPLAA